jgi:iron complex transport system substrate-binding protein
MKKTTAHHVITYLGTIILLSAGCSQNNPQAKPASPTSAKIQIQDGLERQISLAAPAQRVISLSPSNTEILFEVGAGSQLVGRDTFSDFPEEAKAVTDIGGGFGDANLETILATKPDLVLAGDLTPPEQIKSLEELGLTVFVVPNPKDFPGLFEIIRTVAKLTGHESESETLISSLDSHLKMTQEKISLSSSKPLVFYELDGTDPNAPWTAGPGSFVDMMIREAGGINAGKVLEIEWAQISIEELIVQDPDIILLGDSIWGGVTPESVRLRPGWSSLTAIQNDKIYPFDDNLVSRPGPRMVDGLEGLAKLIHPELFP